MYWNRHRVYAALVLLLLGALDHLHAQSKTAKVLRFNLENYAWQPLPKEQRGEPGGTRRKLVSIDHQGRVLIGFTVRDKYSLAAREEPGLSFHILRFTSDGEVDLSLVLPTNSLFTNGFYLGPNDQIFARANDALQWMSEEGGTRKWHPLVPCPRNCNISQSPSRRTLTVSTHSKEFSDRDYDRGVRTNTMLDASSTPPHLVQDCPHSGVITDKFSYKSSDNISTDVRRWPLCDGVHDVELPLDMRGGFVTPLNDEALLLLGTPKEGRGVELVAPDGQVRFREEMPKHDVVWSWPYLASSDERGDRFAFIVQTWRGGSRALDIGGKMVARRLVVYSETGQEIASIPVSTINYSRDFDFSISPDGRRLAILDEGVAVIVDMQ
jgi:hypothetical protein